MRIDELTGVKKYREQSLWDVLRDFEAAGGQWLGSGRYANVIGFPNRNYVWKFFPDDRCYIAYVRWALRNPAPYLPKFLSKPRWIVPFYRRKKTESKICVVKMEKLYPWKVPHLEGHGDLDLNSFFYVVTKYAIRPKGEEVIPLEDVALATNEAYIGDFIQTYPELVGLAKGYVALLNSTISCSLDLHAANIMTRADGTLVFTDPFWIGESPYQAYQRAMADQGMGDMYPEEEDDRHYVSGGQLPKKPKPPKPYVPPPYEEMPF